MKILQGLSVLLAGASFAQAQFNSGSNGSDGAFNPTGPTNVVNMADHPDGIYQYASVNVPANVTVTFIPNAKNTPVVWLVQGGVTISGTVNISGQAGNSSNPPYSTGNSLGGRGGPGGWAGGNGGTSLSSGSGPGGGQAGTGAWIYGANASYGSKGQTNDDNIAAGAIYGNAFLLPLLGGSGGGGASAYSGVGGGGGGGAILIAASGTITLNGQINAPGGDSGFGSINLPRPAGGGSGGAVRLIASRVSGAGQINGAGGGGSGTVQTGWPGAGYAGGGRARFDTYENVFGGKITGVFSQGFQPIIIQTPGQVAQLTVSTVGGFPVSASPTGALSTPDAVLSAQQNNPIPIVVNCANLPLGTPITVSVKPANSATVSAVGYNNTGTLASSTATVLINIPRGGGLIYASAATSQ